MIGDPHMKMFLKRKNIIRKSHEIPDSRDFYFAEKLSYKKKNRVSSSNLLQLDLNVNSIKKE